MVPVELVGSHIYNYLIITSEYMIYASVDAYGLSMWYRQDFWQVQMGQVKVC